MRPLGNNNASSTAGFTLLETIIALAIMVIAFASILDVEDGGIMAAERTKQMNTVAMLARNKMVEMEYYVQGKSFDEVKKDDAGTYESPYEDFHWKSEIKEIKFPNIVATIQGAAAAASGGAGTGSGQAQNNDLTDRMGKLVTNFLSKALREVTVTIFWKRTGGEGSFSVSTYWVDLNHEFELQE
jgi:prepilin-type N-terminal cleavage/methylation domain-containing protein